MLGPMPRKRHRWSPVCDPPQGLVRPVPIDPNGLVGPTRGQAPGPKWRQSSHGLHVPSSVDGSVPEQRILEQSMLLPDGGAVTGWAACRLWSAAFFDGLLPDGATERPVDLVVGPGQSRRRRPGVSFHYDRIEPAEIVTRHGIVCARENRALFDEMRCADRAGEAVVAMDMMAAADLVSISRMRDYLGTHCRWKGAPQVRWALDLASEYSRSPNETRMRLVWQVDAGLPRPRVNQPVFTCSGRLIGVADLFDPEAGVVGEYDGADHRGALRHSKDVEREDRFRRAGLEYFKITGPDLAKVALMVDRMHSTRARAKWLPERERAWTTEPPPWYEVEPSLDEVLDRRAWLEVLHAEWEREGEPDLNEVLGGLP